MGTPVDIITGAVVVPPHRNPGVRYAEIDMLRGVAIVMMVIYHLMFDLAYFGVTDVIFTNPFWFYFQRATAGLFITLVGVSLVLSTAQHRRKGMPDREIFKQMAVRGLRIFAWGMLVTVVTGVVFGRELAVKFGILHFIGVATILAWPFLRLKWFNLMAWIGLWLMWHWLQTVTVAGSWWIWLGLQPANHMYVDYFPLIPWFGVVLLGVFLGNLLYPDGKRRFSLIGHPARATPWLGLLGRHSLTIYLVHQPLLIGLLMLVTKR